MTNKSSNNIRSNPTCNNKPHIVVPYIKGLSESYKNIYSKHGIQMHLKGCRTIKDLLVNSKDIDSILQKSRVIYRYKCGRVDCEEEYIGESGRTFVERLKEHMKALSPIHDHYNTTGHDISIDNFSTVGREDQNMARSIKEAILISINNPCLN